MGCRKFDTNNFSFLEVIHSKKRECPQKKRVNYYPFGLQQKTANNLITGRAHNFKYNNTELEGSFVINWYEMPLRSYDPTIARWNRIDPVTHHSLSTYNGFDNNPIYYADPSGGNGQSFRGGHAARLERMRDNYFGSEYSNLDSFVARVNDHSTTFDDNNNRPGVVYQATNYGNDLVAALKDLGARYDIIATGNPTIEGNDGDCSDCSRCPELCGDKPGLQHASNYDYSQEVIPGKQSEDINFILNGSEPGMKTMLHRLFAILERDYSRDPNSQEMVNILSATSPFLIPGGLKWPFKKTSFTAKELEFDDCRSCANNLNGILRGNILEITNPRLFGGRQLALGPISVNGNKINSWYNHYAVVKHGIVYDKITGPRGMPFSDYKKLFEYADELSFKIID